MLCFVIREGMKKKKTLVTLKGSELRRHVPQETFLWTPIVLIV